MPRDENIRSQRSQVDRQIREHLDQGRLVDFSDKRNVSAFLFGEDLPAVAVNGLSFLDWRGYWFIKEQSSSFVPSQSTFDDFISVSESDPTNAYSSTISQRSDNGKFFYEFRHASDSTEYQYVNLGVSTKFVSGVTASVPITLSTTDGDKVAVFQDGTMVSGGYDVNGGITTVTIYLRKNTATVISVYFYSYQTIQNTGTRSVQVLTPLSAYAVSTIDELPAAPIDLTVTARPEGNLLKWQVDSGGSLYIAGTEIHARREDEQNFKLVGITDGINTQYLHNADVFNYFPNGSMTTVCDQLSIQGSAIPFINLFITYTYFHTVYIPFIDSGWANYAEAYNDEVFRWRFGSDDVLSVGSQAGIYLYLLDNTKKSGLPSFGTHTDSSSFLLRVTTPLTNGGYTATGLVAGIPDCPDATTFWCVFKDPSVVPAGQEDDRHFALGIDDIGINGDFDYKLALHSLLAFTGAYSVATSSILAPSQSDPYAVARPSVQARVKAVVNGSAIVEASQWITLGSLGISSSGQLNDKQWSRNSFTLSAVDMTASIVDDIPVGSDFVVSSVQFKINVLDGDYDYDTPNGVQYYKMWLVGGASLLPTQTSSLESGIEYHYKARHYTNTHILSQFSSEVSAVAVMNQSPAVVLVDVDAGSKWNNETPLDISMNSLSRLVMQPRLYMRHTSSTNMYGNAFRISGWVEVPSSCLVESDSPDFYYARWQITAQAMKDMGFWPEWSDYGFPSWPDEVDDAYYHARTESDKFELRLVSTPADNDSLDVENIFYAVYDTEPPYCQISVVDTYTRQTAVGGNYVLAGGQTIPDSQSSETSVITAKVRLDIPEAVGYASPSWRLGGSRVRFAVFPDLGFTMHKPVSLVNGDWNPDTEEIFPDGLPPSVVTVSDYYELFYPTDSFGNAVAYNTTYLRAKVLNTDYGQWHSFSLSNNYTLEFEIKPYSQLLGINVYVQVENELGELFEFSMSACNLAGPIETGYYYDSVSTGSFTGYTLLDDVKRLYNPLESPTEGGIVTKWSTYSRVKVKSIDRVQHITSPAWEEDTLAICGLALESPIDAVTPFSIYKSNTVGQASWTDGGSGTWGAWPYSGSLNSAAKAMAVHPVTDDIAIVGWVYATEDDYGSNSPSFLSIKQHGMSAPLSVGGVSSVGGFGGNFYDCLFYGGYFIIVGDQYASGYGSHVWILDQNTYEPLHSITLSGSVRPPARCLYVYNNTLYIAGGYVGQGWLGKLHIETPVTNSYIETVASALSLPISCMTTYLYMLFLGFGSDDVSGAGTGNVRYYNGDSIVNFISGSFNGGVLSMDVFDNKLWIGGNFINYSGSPYSFNYGAYFQAASGPYLIGASTAGFIATVRCVKRHVTEDVDRIYFGGNGFLKYVVTPSEDIREHSPSPALTPISIVYDIWSYDHVLQGALLPPDFRSVYNELVDYHGTAAADWPSGRGPFMCKIVGDAPSFYKDVSKFPYLNKALTSCKGLATAGLVGNGIDGFVYRFADSTNTGSYLINLADTQYGNAYTEPSLWEFVDNGYNLAKRISTYVVRHFNPSSVMTSEDFLDDYVRASASPVTPGSASAWNNAVYPATSHVATAGAASTKQIYNAAGALVTPKISPVSNVFAFMLDKPPGTDGTTWTSPVTLLCFPMSDTTGAKYNDNLGTLSGLDDPLYADYVVINGGVNLEHPVTPTTDYLHVSARKNTQAKNVSGQSVATSEREKSLFTHVPGYIPTYSLKYLSDTGEFFSNSTVVYSQLYSQGAVLDTAMDTTSGSYSFGPRVSSDYMEGESIEGRGLIVTDLGETYMLSERGAMSYTYQPYVNIVDPETGVLAHPTRWYGGSQYVLASELSEIVRPKLTVRYGSSVKHVFSYIDKQTGGTSRVMLKLYEETQGRLNPIGTTLAITPPGDMTCVYYDVLSSPDGNKLYLVTLRSPSPYSASTALGTTTTSSNNWAFWFYTLSIGESAITVDSSARLNFHMDNPSYRTSWGIYGMREPRLAWAGPNRMVMAFAIDYGNHVTGEISESRIALIGINSTNFQYVLSNLGDGGVDQIIRVVSLPSRPSDWDTGSRKHAGYARHYSPQLWTNAVINNGSVSTAASLVYVAYIVNDTDLPAADLGVTGKWNTDKTLPLNSYGNAVYCVRTWSATDDKLEMFKPVGVQLLPMGFTAGRLAVDQDNWGNVVMATAERPQPDKINRLNSDKVYPCLRVLKINRVRRNAVYKEIVKPLTVVNSGF